MLALSQDARFFGGASSVAVLRLPNGSCRDCMSWKQGIFEIPKCHEINLLGNIVLERCFFLILKSLLCIPF